jgi:hypothetical protein
MKTFTRTFFMIASMTAAYLWGCTGVEEKEDKYNLLTNSDRKSLSTICKCVEPLIPLINSIGKETDSARVQQLIDSLDRRTVEVTGCMEGLGKLENKFTDEKFVEQFTGFMREKHPDCAPLFLGFKTETKIKK